MPGNTNDRVTTTTTGIKSQFNNQHLQYEQHNWEWKRIMFPAYASVTTGNEHTPTLRKPIGTGNLWAPAMDRATQAEIYTCIPVPSDYVLGTRMRFFMDFTMRGSEIASGAAPQLVNAGDITWCWQQGMYREPTGVERWQPITSTPTKRQQSTNHWYSTYSVQRNTNGEPVGVMRAHFTETLSFGNYGSVIYGRIQRAINRDSDTHYDTGLVIAYGCDYQCDSLGAISRSSKYT